MCVCVCRWGGVLKRTLLYWKDHYCTPPPSSFLLHISQLFIVNLSQMQFNWRIKASDIYYTNCTKEAHTHWWEDKTLLFAFRTSHKSKIDGSSVNVDGWSNITCKWKSIIGLCTMCCLWSLREKIVLKLCLLLMLKPGWSWKRHDQFIPLLIWLHIWLKDRWISRKKGGRMISVRCLRCWWHTGQKVKFKCVKI